MDVAEAREAELDPGAAGAVGGGPPVRVFVSYAHVDVARRRELEECLSSLTTLQLLELWADEGIRLGEVWDERIRAEMEASQVAIFLVSQAFLDSRYIMENEVPHAISRAMAGKMRLWPVIVGPVDTAAWQRCPLSPYQAFPDPKTPVGSGGERWWDWLQVVHRVAEATRDLRLGAAVPEPRTLRLVSDKYLREATPPPPTRHLLCDRSEPWQQLEEALSKEPGILLVPWDDAEGPHLFAERVQHYVDQVDDVWDDRACRCVRVRWTGDTWPANYGACLEDLWDAIPLDGAFDKDALPKRLLDVAADGVLVLVHERVEVASERLAVARRYHTWLTQRLAEQNAPARVLRVQPICRAPTPRWATLLAVGSDGGDGGLASELDTVQRALPARAPIVRLDRVSAVREEHVRAFARDELQSGHEVALVASAWDEKRTSAEILERIRQYLEKFPGSLRRRRHG